MRKNVLQQAAFGWLATCCVQGGIEAELF